MIDNQNNSPPDLTGVKQKIESTLNFADWLLDLWQNSKWSKRLILLTILIAILIGVIEYYFKIAVISDTNAPVFYAILGASIFLAVIIAYFERRQPLPARPDIPERNAIKGLRAFDFNDAAVFKRLQRNTELSSCLSVITHAEFKFGVLYAESGCGKTSFLQAGLYHLVNQHPEHSCVYIKFSNESPEAIVLEALKKRANLHSENALDLVDDILSQQNKVSLLLVLDQFEQFFLHHPHSAQRAAFLRAFTAWYRHKPVKILISIRSDYLYALHELEQAIVYTPNFQEKFALKKFTPQQATEIFKVLAELNELPFDEDFVSHMCRFELAKEAGLITPVDIQILAWLIAGFKQEGHLGFNKKLFLKKGGVEGLLENFLAFSIESLSGKSNRELAVKVLLTLIDKEQNLRAGALSYAQIQEKLSGIAAGHVAQMLAWLEDSKVRLITAIDEEGSEKKYELTHEKLIKGVFNLAKDNLVGYEQANLLLERRVAEWLGNGKSRSFLLSLSDYRTIRKNQPFLIWGEREIEKKHLLAASKRKWQWQAGAVSLVLLIFSAWEAWLHFTPQGQIYECQISLQDVNRNKFPSNTARRDAVKALLAGGKADMSLLAPILPIAEKMNDGRDKAEVFKELARAAVTLDRSQALTYLKQVKTGAEKMIDGRDKAEVFKVLALAAVALDRSQALAYLNQAKTAEEKITDDYDKVKVFQELAQAAVALDPSQALAYLNQVKTAAEKITHDYYKAEVFKELAQVAVALDQSQALAYLNQAKTAAEKITDDYYKAEVFKELAQAAVALDQSQALAYLNQAKTAAEKITYEVRKANVFKELAQVAVALDQSQALAYLNQAKTAAEKITDDYYKAEVFKELAQAAGTFDQSQALAYLNQAKTAAEKITDDYQKALFFKELAQAADALDPSQALAYLNQAKTAAEKITDDYQKALFFKELAQAADALDPSQALAYLNQAKTAAEKITDDYQKALFFKELAQATVALDPSQALVYLDQAKTVGEKIKDNYDKAQVFTELAEAAVALDSSQALAFLKKLIIAVQSSGFNGDESRVQVLTHLFGAMQKLSSDENDFIEILSMYSAGRIETVHFLENIVMLIEEMNDKQMAIKLLNYSKDHSGINLNYSNLTDFFITDANASLIIRGISEGDKGGFIIHFARAISKLESIEKALEISVQAEDLAQKTDQLERKVEIFTISAEINAQAGHYAHACNLAQQGMDADSALKLLAIVLREYGKNSLLPSNSLTYP